MPVWKTFATATIESITGTVNTLTLERYTDDAVTAASCSARADAVLAYGDLAADDPALVASRLEVTLYDETGTVASEIAAAAADVELRLTLAATDKSWQGRITRQPVRRPVYGWTAQAAVTISAYDIIAYIDSGEADFPEAATVYTVHGLIEEFVLSAEDRQVDYAVLSRPKNHRALSGGNGPLVAEILFTPWCRCAVPLEVLSAALQSLDARLFRDYRTDRFVVESRSAAGSAIDASLHPLSRYTPGSGIAHVASNRAASQISADTISRSDAEHFGELSLGTIHIETEHKPSYPWQLVRDESFERWPSLNVSMHWDNTTGLQQGGVPPASFPGGRTGLYSGVVTAGNMARQWLGRVNGGGGIELELLFWARDAGTTGGTLNYRLKIVPDDPTASTQYSTAAGAWTTADAWLSTAVLTASYVQTTLDTTAAPPVTGSLYVEFSIAAQDACIDDVTVNIKKLEGGTAVDESARDYLTVTSTGKAVGTGRRDYVRPWTFGQRAAAFMERTVIDIGPTVWEACADWQDESGATFTHLEALFVDAVRRRNGVLAADVHIDGMISPGDEIVLDGAPYYVLAAEIDLFAETSRATVRQKYKTITV